MDNIEEIELWGNYDTSTAKTIQVRVKRCKGKETCKSDQEIEEFIDNNGHFSLLSNYQKYSNEDYGPDTIQNVSFAELNPITSNSRQI